MQSEDFSRFEGYVAPSTDIPPDELCSECGKNIATLVGPEGETLCRPCGVCLATNITGLNRAERRRQAKAAQKARILAKRRPLR